MTKVIKRVRTKTESATKTGLIAIGTMLISVGVGFLTGGQQVEGIVCIVAGSAMFLVREITKNIW